MKKVKVLFKDSDHPSNRDIIAFLIMNLDKLNQVGILVDFRIVADNELPALRQRGVTKLPILVVGGKKIYERSSEIKDALKQLYIHNGKMGGPEASKKFESGDPDEQMREFMETDLNMDAWEDDDGDDDSNANHMDKVLAMAAQRTKERMERGSSKYNRPHKRSKEEREREGGRRHKKGRRQHQHQPQESESAMERIQRQSGGGGRHRGGAPVGTRDDQLMMDKFDETGISMDM